jgi:hypothetical protein
MIHEMLAVQLEIIHFASQITLSVLVSESMLQYIMIIAWTISIS